MTRSPSSSLLRPLLIALVLTAGGIAAAYWMLGMPPLLGAEDASIGFRYARNLAEGHGIVFNAGGERVEGFTSMLWLFVSAAVYMVVGRGPLETTLLVLSIAITLVVPTALLWTISDAAAASERRRFHYRGTVHERRAARRFQWLGRPGVWLAVLWMAALPGFWFWSGLSLMDVAIWAAGLTAYLLLLYRALEGGTVPRGALAAIVVALMLTRPESMLVVPATVVFALLVYGLTPVAWRTAIVVVGTSMLSVAGLTAFRLWYFGHPLPNTYYAKVSPDVAFRLRAGVGYLENYVGQHPLGWLGVGAVGTFLLGWLSAVLRGWSWRPNAADEPRELGSHDRRDGASVAGTGLRADGRPDDRWLADPGARVATLAAGLVMIGVASVVWGGGDHYQGHRFLQAYLPIVALPLAVGLEELRRRTAARSRALGYGIVAGALVLMAAPMRSEWATFGRHGLRQQAMDVGLEGRFLAQTLNQAFDPGTAPELGLWMVGGAGYVYEGPVKDLLGLNWLAMGMSPGDRKGPRDHAAFDLDVFWSAPPEMMIPEPQPVLGNYGLRCVGVVMGGVLRGVLTTDRFRSEFAPVRVRSGDNVPIIAYGRRDWIRRAPPTVEALDWSYCDVASH